MSTETTTERGGEVYVPTVSDNVRKQSFVRLTLDERGKSDDLRNREGIVEIGDMFV